MCKMIWVKKFWIIGFIEIFWVDGETVPGLCVHRVRTLQDIRVESATQMPDAVLACFSIMNPADQTPPLYQCHQVKVPERGKYRGFDVNPRAETPRLICFRTNPHKWGYMV